MAPHPGLRFTSRRKALFLAMLAGGLSVAAAARAAGMSRNTVYRHRAADAAFREDWEGAWEEGLDRLEDECFRRAVHGWDEPVYYQGEQVGVVRRYSDRLLIFLLERRIPERYGRTVEVRLAAGVRLAGGSRTLERLVLASVAPTVGAVPERRPRAADDDPSPGIGGEPWPAEVSEVDSVHATTPRGRCLLEAGPTPAEAGAWRRGESDGTLAEDRRPADGQGTGQGEAARGGAARAGA